MRRIRPRPNLPLVALAVVAACAALSCREPPTDTWAAVRAAGVLRWGADLAGGEPYVYEDPSHPGRIIGFEHDIMEALARELGVSQRFVQTDWSNLVPSLERGDFDIVINGLEATAQRAERILLSRPYFTYSETLAVHRDAPYRTLADLRGKRVGTLNQSYAHDLLVEAGVEIALYEGNEEPYIDLVNGRVDAVLLDNIIADRYGCNRTGVLCLPGDVARGTYIIGVRKTDPALKAAIDGGLAALIADGELERILRKHKLWDHRQVEPPPPVPGGSAATPRFDGEHLRRFVIAAGVTLGLSVGSFCLAVPLGLLLALGRVYGGVVARALSRGYIELFRGTPVLLQLYVLYYGLGPYYAMEPVTAAVLGLGLNYAAYEAEVYRGAILAIPRGQTEAAKALGMGPVQTLRHVVVPQAFRLALPPMTNDFIALLKDSSLVSVITVIELTKRMMISGAELHGWLVPGLACAGLYLLLSLPLSELARQLERRLARDTRPHAL